MQRRSKKRPIDSYYIFSNIIGYVIVNLTQACYAKKEELMLLHAKNVLLRKRRFVSHDCLHADIIVFTRAAIDNKPSSVDRKKQLYEIVRNGRNAGKTVRSRVERYHDGKVTPSRENMVGLECEHLQGSCRYRQSMLCSRPRPARRAGRGFSRFASRIPHSDYSTRGNSILSLRMYLSLAPSPPFRKSPHNHLFNLYPFHYKMQPRADVLDFFSKNLRLNIIRFH